MSLDVEEVREMLIACLPAGARDLYDLDNRASDVSKYVDALAASVKLYGTDVVDTLRAELLPSTARELITAWERALGVDRTRIAQAGTQSQRVDQIRARLRESGTATRGGIYAALVAFCGPTAVTILEHKRSVLTSTNTRAFSSTTVAANSTGTLSVMVTDNAPAGQMGAQLIANLSGGAATITLTLTAPTGDAKSWSALVDSSSYSYFWPEFAGLQCAGVWTLTVDNSANGNPVDVDIASVFVEGIGRAQTGAEGYGSTIFEWTALIDESVASTSYDRATACDLVRRWSHAHATGGLALVQTTGSVGAVSDNTNCIADLCVCG